MHRHSLVAGLILLAARPVLAQQHAVLRFQPELGRMARTLTEIRTATTLVGFPAAPDGAVFTEETWISATQRVMTISKEGALVEVVVDSIRGRVRLAADPWRDAADTAVIGRPAQAVLSPRFHIVGIRSSGETDGEVLQTLGAYATGLNFAFPEAPVIAGETFATGDRLRVRVRTADATGLVIDEVVFGDLALTLDSVVGAGSAQLGYLHFQGPLTPRTGAAASEGGDVVTELSGAFAGRLVWSAQWGAFVSGALRVRVTGRVRVQGPAGEDTAEAIWDRTVVHRVRP